MLIWFPFNKNCKPPWDDRWYVRYIKIHIIIIIIIIIISAVSMVTRLAGALVWAECICTNSSSMDTIVNSADTFIDILQECKRKNKKIFEVRKPYRSATKCNLSIYGILLILHLFHVFYMDACTDHEFSSRDEKLTLASWLTCAPKVNCTLSLESILKDIIFVYLKVIRNRKARKCLIKAHLLCACHRTPM